MIDFLQARTNMIDCQIHTAGVIDEQILHSFASIPRELFVPDRLKDVSYSDDDLNIGQGRYLLEPITHSKMLQAVKPNSSDIVLDIGVGSGYSSAILSSLVTTIIALENNKRQMDKASKLWQDLDACNIVLMEGALEKGVAEQSPYSLIIINGAVAEVPESILDQLDVGGRLITIIQKSGHPVGKVTLFIKGKNGDISSKHVFDAGAAFLKGFEPKNKFNF